MTTDTKQFEHFRSPLRVAPTSFIAKKKPPDLVRILFVEDPWINRLKRLAVFLRVPSLPKAEPYEPLVELGVTPWIDIGGIAFALGLSSGNEQTLAGTKQVSRSTMRLTKI